jgi:hypothetical protein
VTFRTYLPLVGLLAGCGGPMVTPLGELCVAACRKQLGCEGKIAPDCASECERVASRWRMEYQQAYFLCYAEDFSTMCSGDDSMCSDRAYYMLQERTVDRSFTQACYQRSSACMGMFPGDRCNISRAYHESYVNEARECLDRACPEIEGCMADAFGS